MTPAELRARHVKKHVKLDHVPLYTDVCEYCSRNATDDESSTAWPCDTIQACDHYDRLRHDVLEEAAKVTEDVVIDERWSPQWQCRMQRVSFDIDAAIRGLKGV